MVEDTQRVSAVHRLYSVVYSQERLTIEYFFPIFVRSVGQSAVINIEQIV